MRKLTLTLLLLLGSTAAYSVNGVLEYMMLRHLGLYEFFLLWSLDGVLALPVLLKSLRLRNDLFRRCLSSLAA